MTRSRVDRDRRSRVSEGRRPAWIWVLLLCVPLSTTSCDWMRRVLGMRPTTVLSIVPSQEEVRGAMLSVYYHAYGLDLLRPPPNGTPIPLLRAANILSRDVGPGAPARRRRAISKLAVGAVLRTDPADLEDALAGLMVSRARVTGLLEHVRDVPRPSTLQLPLPWPQPLPIVHVPIRPFVAQLIQAALQYLEANPSPIYPRTCCAGVEVCEVDPAQSSTDEASTHFQIRVRRDVAELRKSIDPQDWDACVPDYFQDTSYESAVCPVSGSIGVSQGPPPAPGSGWDGALYEHYQVDFSDGTSTYFKNRLQICGEWNPLQKIFRYHYALCRPGGSLSSSVLGDGPKPGGLEKDCGILLAFDDTPSGNAVDYSLVRGIKFLRFDPRSPDPGAGLWANLGLEILVDEIADTAMCCGAQDDDQECKVADEQCIQAMGSSKGWKLPVPACQISGDVSPACSDIEN